MSPAHHLHVVTGPDQGWEPATPLGPAAVLPPFPVDALPGWLAEYVAGVATETQTPPDLAACIGLAALSTAAGGRARVQVRGNWVEPVNLYVVVALPPGTRKSAVFRAIIGPILDVEAELAADTRPLIEMARIEASIARERAEKARHAAVQANGDQRHAVGLAVDAAVQAENFPIPVLPRLVADDVTPEKAASLIAEHGGRIAVLSAEGGIIATLAGRYSATPNYEVFLKGHAGDLLRVDRHGRPGEHVDAPALTLGLAVQPEVLREIAKIPGGRGKGLLGRILYSLPEDLVGHRQIAPQTVPEHVADTYTANLQTLVRTLGGWTGPTWSDPADLALTEEAAALVYDLETETEPRLAAGGEWCHARDWYSKWVGAVVRVAGLIHLAHHVHDGWRKPVGGATMVRAEQIGRYYAHHAAAVYHHMGTDDPVTDDARHILDWIKRTHREQFTRRDLFAGVRSQRFTSVTDLDHGLELLERHGHIRLRTPTKHAQGGRPSQLYDVHPATHTAAATGSAPSPHQGFVGSVGFCASSLPGGQADQTPRSAARPGGFVGSVGFVRPPSHRPPLEDNAAPATSKQANAGTAAPTTARTEGAPPA